MRGVREKSREDENIQSASLRGLFVSHVCVVTPFSLEYANVLLAIL